MELTDIKESFEFFDDWEDKYRFILEIGKDLPEMDGDYRIEENLIRGCQSQVWLVYSIEDNKLRFQIDSDAHIVRGLLKILLVAINNLSPSEIIETD